MVINTGKRILLLFILALVVFSCSENKIEEAEKTNKPDDNTQSHSTQKQVRKASLINVEEKVDPKSQTTNNSSIVKSFYLDLLDRIASMNENITFKESGPIRLPESLAEELEGGGIIPYVIELRNNFDLVSIIIYSENDPYPTTYSIALPMVDDGFTLPIAHYELIEINHRAVLRVLRTTSGLLSEGPFIQSFYPISGFGRGISPLYSSKGEVISEEDEDKVGKLLVESDYPKGSFTSDCPEDIGGSQDSNLQLDFNQSGILTKTCYTGFTTEFFYYLTQEAKLICWPLSKFMISPDDERIEEEITSNKQSADWVYSNTESLESIRLTNCTQLLTEGIYCN